jgi:hypothetical protein
MIGANSVVLHEVPDNGTVVGFPANWFAIKANLSIMALLDHDRVPDPMEQELCQLLHRVASLEKALTEYTGHEIHNPFKDRLTSLSCPCHPLPNPIPKTQTDYWRPDTVIRIFNTETRSKEELKTIEPGKVKMYVCGPTVYNFFTWAMPGPFITYDTFRRFLLYRGYGSIMSRISLISTTR